MTLAYETTPYAPQFTSSGPGLLHQLQAAADAGFDGVFLDAATIGHYLAGGGTFEQVTQVLERDGLALVGMSALAMHDLDASMSGLVAAVDALRPPLVLTVCRCEPSPGVIDATSMAADRLAGMGARLAIEFVPFLPIRTLAAAVQVAGQVGHGAGVCLDAWHFLRGTPDWALLAGLPPRVLAYVQFTDALPVLSSDPIAETMDRRTFCGRGELDLWRLSSALRAMGYAGAVGLEVLSAEQRGRDCVGFAHELMQTARPYWT
jgi:sugar phosphate isomerase/epimerase